MIKQLFKWARKYWYKEIRTVWRTKVHVELDVFHYSAQKLFSYKRSMFMPIPKMSKQHNMVQMNIVCYK